ncbi:hypothetical protein R3I94_012041 [Phoxinus phoxinus]
MQPGERTPRETSVATDGTQELWRLRGLNETHPIRITRAETMAAFSPFGRTFLKTENCRISRLFVSTQQKWMCNVAQSG